MYRYSKENKLPSPAEKMKYKDVIYRAQNEIIHAGHYHIGKGEMRCNKHLMVLSTMIQCSVLVMKHLVFRVVDNIDPTHLIIDEAAMATEPDAMIPITLAKHVTLIGDHMQLQVCS